jgi:prophage DNA circulation protein
VGGLILGTIRDLHNPWRDDLLPAMFDGVPFYTDSGARESGRRTVVHEYPKSDRCYAEDMGLRAIEFTVRAYCIAYVNDAANPQTGLRYRDYRISRDRLQTRLDAGGEGILQLPNMARAGIYGPLTINVVCTRYRMTEEDRYGGYVTFEMTFVEYGEVPMPKISTKNIVFNAMQNGQNQITNNLTPQP